jgi:hypothetical protein
LFAFADVAAESTTLTRHLQTLPATTAHPEV